jgi:methyltransferase-like protein
VSGLNDRALVESQIDQDLNLCRLLFSGIVQIHSAPGRFATSVPERPAVSELVRHQARNGARVTSERHEGIALGRAERALVQFLDGTQGMPAIAEKMRCLVRDGDLTLDRDGQPVSGDEHLGEEVQACCQAILERFAKNALLLEEA